MAGSNLLSFRTNRAQDRASAEKLSAFGPGGPGPWSLPPGPGDGSHTSAARQLSKGTASRSYSGAGTEEQAQGALAGRG